MRGKFSSLVAGVMALSLVMPGSAWADALRYQVNRAVDDAHHSQRDFKWRGDWRHNPRHHHRRIIYYGHRDHGDEDLLFGMLFGGLLGYAIGNSQQVDRYPPPPQSQVRYPAPQYDYNDRGPVCLQKREYQMTVIIGGREQQAYGTACLQPDGSWLRGPARLVSY